jgi:hypothetical protein
MAGRTGKGKSKDSRTDALVRTRDNNYTPEERAQILEDIRDNSLDWVATQAAEKKGAGTSSAFHLYQTAVVELRAIEDGSEGIAKLDLSIPGFDMSKLVFNKESKPEEGSD